LYTLGSSFIIAALAHFLAFLFHGKGYALILTKNVFGYILGYLFANSSGHPVQLQSVFRLISSRKQSQPFNKDFPKEFPL
jgi:Na+-translocating ferredoxin:NAD+ oxidoreductase RnfD subunit